MKKIIILLLAQVTFVCAYAQIQATLKAGATRNAVIVAIKPTTTLTGTKMSSFQFAVGIPASITPQPTTTVASTNMAVSFPAPLISTEVQDGVSYTVYTFSGDGAQSGTGIDYLAGQEYNYVEVTFIHPDLVPVADTRLIQLPNGGSNANVNFYVADRGGDVTEQAAQFYSSLTPNFSNDGNGYGGSSWAKFDGLVLPVRFLNFSATKNNNNALLNWAVEAEDANTASYEIQRSLSGVDFSTVGTVAPLNNGRGSNTYSFTQESLSSIRNAGVIYFRIKQIDRDGKFVYSEIRSVRLDGKKLVFGVYPNPIKTTANVTFDLVENERVVIKVIDAAGKQVVTSQIQGFKGANITKVDMAKLAAGSYTMSMQAGDEVKTITVVKANQ